MTATIDLTHVAAEQGGKLGRYVQKLETTLRKSKFRWQYELLVSGISLERLNVDLSRIHFREVNFESTDLTGSGLPNGVRLTRCLVDSSLPPLTVSPGELFRYPPVKAAKELNITNPKDVCASLGTQPRRQTPRPSLFVVGTPLSPNRSAAVPPAERPAGPTGAATALVSLGDGPSFEPPDYTFEAARGCHEPASDGRAGRTLAALDQTGQIQ